MNDRFSSLLPSSSFAQNENGTAEGQWMQTVNGLLIPRTPLYPHQPQHDQKISPAVEDDGSDRPAPDVQDGWQRYWAKQGWSWRWEEARQAELTKRRAIQAEVKQGMYPFLGIFPLKTIVLTWKAHWLVSLSLLLKLNGIML